MTYLLLCYMFIGVVSALSVVLLKNSVHAVFSLIITFVVSTGILFTILTEFLAIIFIIIYVGAIAVLFLFVIMMLNIKFVHYTESSIRYIPLGIIMGIIFISQIYFVNIKFNDEGFFSQKTDWIYYLTKKSDTLYLLADVIYSHYLNVFVVAGLLLLLAMLGTINITLYHANNVKRQALYKQLQRYEKKN